MMLFLSKKLPFPKSSSTVYAFHLLHSSTLSSSVGSPPAPKPIFMAEYLVTSCVFSLERAATVAANGISHVTSPLKPDSVRHFLKHHGFTDPQIRTLIASYPRILCCSIGRQADSNLRSLREMGFLSEHDLRNVIIHNPPALHLASAVPRFMFWRAFFDGDTKSLTLAFTRNRNLIGQDLDTGIAPKFALLKEYDISQTGIKTVIVRGGRFIAMSALSIEALLKSVEEFGFPRGSSMFVLAILSFYGLSKGILKTKMDLYKSFGWSDEDLLSAILKFPFILRISEENIRAKMTFFLQKAGCAPGYVARFPSMIGYSLEKRLAPRHHVMQILKSNELLGTKWSFYYVMVLSDQNFVERIVLPHKNKFPTLLETYVAACAGKILV